MKANGVLETCLYAADLLAARHFYSEILGLELFSEVVGRHLFFRCGDGMLFIFDPAIASTKSVTVGGGAIPNHGSIGAGHIAFRATLDELTAWKAHLTEHSVEIESEVVWGEGMQSIYFRDPAGNSLEFATPIMYGLK